mgnify:CR=1 FL=1
MWSTRADTITARFGRALAAGALAALVIASSALAEVPFKTISSSGPLTSVAVGNEGSCQIGYQGDARLELFPSGTTPGDCGTLIFTGTALYAPSFSSHGGSAASGIGASTPYTPVSQTEVSGAGSAASPSKVTTVYDVGTTGIRVTEVNSYVAGQEYYRTDVSLKNTTTATQTGIIYRAGDCYLQESDTGYGFVESSNSGPGCARNADNTPAARIEQWVPLTAGSAYIEDSFGTVWRAIGAHTMFPSTCKCSVALDNGAGLSWPFTIAAGATHTFSHLTVFSPTGITGGQQQSAPGRCQVPRARNGLCPSPPPAAAPAAVRFPSRSANTAGCATRWRSSRSTAGASPSTFIRHAASRSRRSARCT